MKEPESCISKARLNISILKTKGDGDAVYEECIRGPIILQNNKLQADYISGSARLYHLARKK